MLTHDQIWSAIDRLAARKGLSASSLARQAGLDATTFNRSKRKSADGNARWPSTESIAKILAATHVPVDEFLALIPGGEPAPCASIPFRMLDDNIEAAFLAAGGLCEAQWESIPAPASGQEGVFALGISGARFEPLYHEGDIIIAAPGAVQRRGDRVLLIDHAGKADIAILGQMTASSIHLKALDGTALPPHRRADIRLLARILWVSQ